MYSAAEAPKVLPVARLLSFSRAHAAASASHLRFPLGDGSEQVKDLYDSLGEEFLSYVQDGMTITIRDDGTVEVA